MALVIFDIDGTLTDTTGIDDYCFFKTFFDLFSIDLTGSNWNNYKNVTDTGITNEVFYERLGRLPTAVEINQIKTYFLKLLNTSLELAPERFTPIPGAKEVIHRLIERKCKIAFATGAWEEAAVVKLNKMEIDPRLFPFGHSDYHYSRKEIIWEALRQAEIKYREKSKVVYVGDGKWDYEVCKALGIDFIGIDFRKTGALKKLGAQMVFADFNELSSILNFECL